MAGLGLSDGDQPPIRMTLLQGAIQPLWALLETLTMPGENLSHCWMDQMVRKLSVIVTLH